MSDPQDVETPVSLTPCDWLRLGMIGAEPIDGGTLLSIVIDTPFDEFDVDVDDDECTCDEPVRPTRAVQSAIGR